MLILRMAWNELFRSFLPRPPGGRDFAYLLALIALLQLLGIVIFSAKLGVLERSVDAFLGKVPGYGVPVWVRQNYLAENDAGAMTQDMVDDLEARGFPVQTFRRTFDGDLIRLPAQDVWTEPRLNAEPAFEGIFADTDSVLAGQQRSTATATRLSQDVVAHMWSIVLDRENFAQFLDLDAYRAALAGRVPPAALDDIPQDTASLDDMSLLWLEMRVNDRAHLVPFRVTWANYLGAGHIAPDFVLPAALHTLEAAASASPGLCLDFSAGPAPIAPVAGVQSPSLLLMSAEDRAARSAPMGAALTDLHAAMGGSLSVANPSRVSWSAPDNSGGTCAATVPWVVAALFATGGDLALSDWDGLSPQPVPDVGVDVSLYTAPCSAINPRERAFALGATDSAQSSCGDDPITIETANASSGYDEMLVFAEDRIGLDGLVSVISCDGVTSGALDDTLCMPLASASDESGDQATESRIAIHNIYRDSLMRFGFLSRLIDAVSGPVGWSLVGLGVAILWVQLGTVLGHRRGQYATLIVGGLSPLQIVVLVCTQVAMCVVLGLAVAFGLFVAIRATLFGAIRALSTEYDRIALGEMLDVLPVPALGLLAFLGFMLLIGWALTYLQLRSKGVSRGGVIDRLME
ncbi:hypothetical protein SAMN05428995_10410 [Loktanella sp. DSM 29012]|uniref:hypothetical protein n=1 Tax=Loktanella sp. DSM 29012 TaxID=1881056 RepID=UPI0008D2C522|nr:hypothetical protein [Loktanella sp. DSM 29012]SEQ35721.1 hypothetical protein SAMN05428995_10410 [Loktanella sp. DSM 29012]